MSVLYVLITALCFTTHEPVSKLFAADINPYAVTAIRFFIGALFLLPFSVRQMKKDKLSLTLKDLAIMCTMGVLFICVSMVLLQVAVTVGDSPALIAILFSSNSIMTIILSSVFLKSKLTLPKIIGIALCVAGVLVSADLSKGSNILSVVLALCSALIFSAYTVFCKKYMTRLPGSVQSGFTFLFGSIILIIVLLILKVDIIGGITAGNVLQLLYVSIVVTGIGYLAFYGAINKGGPQVAALAFLIKPILTPFATYFINGIAPGVTVFAGLVLVVAGAALATRSK